MVFSKRGWGVICALSMALGGAAHAEDVFYDVSIAGLTYDAGQSPAPRTWGYAENETFAVLEPFVRLDGDGEAYVDWSDTRGAPVHLTWVPSSEAFRRLRVGVRAPAGETVKGVLYLPEAELDGFTRHAFTVEPTAARADGCQDFLRRKLGYLDRKAAGGFPGAGWFRHQAALVRAELEGESFWGPSTTVRRWRTSRDIDETFELFSGGRAIAENLALDSGFDPVRAAEQLDRSYSLEEIEGIIIDPIDWAPLLEGLDPELDPLARLIPHDQHALFFPSFDALAALVDEAHESGTPILQLLEPRVEDARTQERYERQLCFGLDAGARLFGPALVKSVAITGSDPYLRTGSDLAILFEAKNADVLHGFLRERQRAALEENPDAGPIEGTVGGLEWSGVVSPDRTISSLLLRLDDVVCATNNFDQLKRLSSVYRGETRAIAELDEYRFFRDRYPRGAEGETAFFLLTDATLRRWMRPRWRIGASRRTRAAALMAQYQAAHAEELIAGTAKRRVIEQELAVPGGGDLLLSPTGVVSPEYGTLAQLTPILSLDLGGVTQTERDAYERFRNRYERQWSRFFDPIAASISVAPEKLALDLTVMPLVFRTEYRDLIEIAGAAKLDPEASGAPGETIMAFVLALDHDARMFREVEGYAEMAWSPRGRALRWVGDSLAVHVGRDEFWSEMAAADDQQDFLWANLYRLPVALEIDVGNPLELAAFLTGLRGFVDSAGPELLVWETREHLGRSYVRVGPADEPEWGEEYQDYALHYAVLPGSWVLSLNEGLIQRLIERVEAAPEDDAPARPWLGKSAALRLESDALDLIRGLARPHFRDRMRLRAWKNLPILEEWRRLFPGRDPLEVHEELWNTRLLCPGGGEYVWNEALGVMESSVYGSPVLSREGPELPVAVRALEGVDLGLTFENDGLRARGELRRK